MKKSFTNSDLINSIKSKFILKKIFLCLNEYKKLLIIQFNKHAQIKLDVNIDNYKAISVKYFVEEKNEKVKEYSSISFDKNGDNTLIFEGEYKKGKKDGQGKEYYKNGKIKFEGEYLKGKRFNGKGYLPDKKKFEIKNFNGIGKEYDEFCKLEYLKFEHDREKRKRNGKWIKYHKNGDIKFEGEYLNGKRNGKCKEYYTMGVIKCNEEYLNGIKIGKCFEYYSNGALKFISEYSNGKKNGHVKEYSYVCDGKCIYNYLIFEGEYLNGKRNGYGKEYNYNGNIAYEGEYLNGKRNGYGKAFNYNGKITYEGEYLNGERNGYGKEYDFYGYIAYEGEYLNGFQNKLE